MAALQPAALGTLGFAAFLASMTIGRWFADGVLGRYGRVAVIRGQMVLAAAVVLALATLVTGALRTARPAP